MKIKSFLFVSLFFISIFSQIEIPLYKSPLAYENLQKNDTMIDDIDKTHFLVDLHMGTPSRAYPLQVEMAIEDIYIVNDKFIPKKDFLSQETSQTFESENSNKEEVSFYPAKDNICINGKNFLIKFRSSQRILEEPLNDESSGILGLSLGDITIEKKNKNRFTEQLTENKLTENSTFFFEFDEAKIEPKCKVPTLKNYLNIKGRLYIGDFPYNFAPNQCNKNKVKTSKVIQVIKNDEIPLKDYSSLSIQFEMEKCIGCTACVKACSNIAGQDILA